MIEPFDAVLNERKFAPFEVLISAAAAAANHVLLLRVVLLLVAVFDPSTKGNDRDNGDSACDDNVRDVIAVLAVADCIDSLL